MLQEGHVFTKRVEAIAHHFGHGPADETYIDDRQFCESCVPATFTNGCWHVRKDNPRDEEAREDLRDNSSRRVLRPSQKTQDDVKSLLGLGKVHRISEVIIVLPDRVIKFIFVE